MRRSDRKIKDEEVILNFISNEKIIRIGFCDEKEVYIVPVNYGFCRDDYGKYIFYFHGAMSGRKYELSQNKPYVGFEIDGHYELIKSDSACRYSAKYQSIIGSGKVHIVEDSEEMLYALKLIMKQISDKSEWSFDVSTVKATAVFRIDVEKLSCKARL